MNFWSRQSWSGLFSYSHNAARARQRRTGRLAALEQLESREMLTGFLVTSIADTNDTGTLRWAMQSANDTPGADTITFDSSFDSAQSIVLEELQLPTLTGTTIISGPGADLLTISGNGLQRVFQVAEGAVVSITGVMVVDGSTSQSASGSVNDIGRGGAILNYGQLMLSDVTLSGNQADYYGGSIYNGGLLSMSDSTITESWSLNGGGVYSPGVFIASHVDFLNNTSLYGGGAIVADGTVSLSYCLIEGNTASEYGSGGGIYQGSSDTAVMTISYSTIANNSAFFYGGGLYNLGHVTITSSTISGNTAETGGGVYSSGHFSLSNSTVAENSAANGGGLFNAGLMDIVSSTISTNTATNEGGGIRQSLFSPFVILSSTIVFGNSGNGVANNVAGPIAIQDSGGNLFGPGSDGFWAQNSGFNRNLFFEAGTDIGLGPLGNNGGVTKTMALLPDSPAIDRGDMVHRFGPDYASDQRGDGFSRVLGAAQDVGAVESSFAHGATFVLEEASYVTYVGINDLLSGPISFSLTGGDDQEAFTIDPESGKLEFVTPADYENPGDANADNVYQIEVTIIDDNGLTVVVLWTVEVENAFEMPVLALSANPAVYQIGSAAVRDSNAELQSEGEIYDEAIAGAKLIVSITENRDAKDLLKIVSQGTGAGQISVKKNNVLFGGIVVGTVAGGTKASPNLVVTFNGAATQSAVNAVMRQVGFSTKNKKIPQPARTLQMQIVDLFGYYSTQDTRQINVLGRS